MAIAHSGTDTNNGHDTAASSSTHAHTNAGDFIVVGVGPGDATLGERTVSTVTFNADALTHASADSDLGYERSELWYRISPDAATGNVVVTMGGTCDNLDVFASSYTGVDLDSQPDNAV